MPLQKAEALFNFKPTAPVELELKKGDVLVVRRTSVGDGWWEGELNGKRGLFPSSFVKMLPASAGSSPVKERAKTPLTPGSSKKAFMETLLTPSTNVQDQLYDKEKASDIFVQGHSDICIAAGPRWDCFPPTLTIIIKDLHTETRFSGVKHFTVFDVETKQLGTQVTRRYKNFLWLYDKMAEFFPCISLPPLPVKQFSGLEEHGIEARRRGLENFLNRVANHPVLGSTKLLRDFLTAKDDKDWKIGRQLSNIKLPKSAKRLFTAPVYATVKYPPFNVPINQLPSIEKFSRFSRLMELQMQALQNSCQLLCHSGGEMMSKVNMVGKDIQKMARGSQPSVTVGRRKVTPTHVSNLAIPNGQTGLRAISDVEDDESDGEMDEKVEWNWRDDSQFNCMMRELYNVAGGMRKMANLQHDHQESIQRNVLDSLTDYVGIIHTLPTLVRLHEEALEVYNISKEKDTKKEAEEVRQHFETLNNVILAEFDHFSNTMIGDFETIVLNLLKEQAAFHKQVAKSWDSLYESYVHRRASTHPQGTERITSCGKSFSFDKSGSFTGSFLSSHNSTGSFEQSERNSDADSTLMESVPPEEPSGIASLIPTYINVERMDPKKQIDDSIIDTMSVSPPKDSKVAAAEDESNAQNHELLESVIVHQLEDEQTVQQEDQENYIGDSEEDIHSYANIELREGVGCIVPVVKSAPNSPKKPKKPMPIKRKQGSSERDSQGGASSLSSSLEIANSFESNSSPSLKAKVPQKPLPPVKPQRPICSDNPPVREEKPPSSVSSPKLNQLVKKKPIPEKKMDVAKIPETRSTDPMLEGRSRSKTTLETGPEKKQPLLPPLKPLKGAKTTDNLPASKGSESPPKATNTTILVHHPALKPKLSEPVRSRVLTGSTSTSADTSTHTGREELMRKLSLRRQRIEQQLGTHRISPHKTLIGNIVETPSERNSTISSSSSEVVVSYSTRVEENLLPSNGATKGGGESDTGDVLRRTKAENESLAKYGIIEDTEGGSFVI